MKIGDLKQVSGYFTQEKFLAGRTLEEIEKTLGYHRGRLSQGLAVVVLLRLPEMKEFNLGGHTNVAAHRQTSPGGLDIDKLKTLVRGGWALTGPDRLVKALPAVLHDSNQKPDFQYPPGLGAPQWKLEDGIRIDARVLGVVSEYPNGRFVASDVVRR